MNKLHNLSLIQQQATEITKSFLGENHLLILFGSAARNETDQSSDIDLAIYQNLPIPEKTMTEIHDALNNQVRTLRILELINLTDKNLNKQLLENIIKEGVVWSTRKNSSELWKSLKNHLNDLKKS